MPGYFQPGLFEGMFAFVYERGYERGTFRQYMQQRAGQPVKALVHVTFADLCDQAVYAVER